MVPLYTFTFPEILRAANYTISKQSELIFNWLFQDNYPLMYQRYKTCSIIIPLTLATCNTHKTRAIQGLHNRTFIKLGKVSIKWIMKWKSWDQGKIGKDEEYVYATKKRIHAINIFIIVNLEICGVPVKYTAKWLVKPVRGSILQRFFYMEQSQKECNLNSKVHRMEQIKIWSCLLLYSFLTFLTINAKI